MLGEAFAFHPRLVPGESMLGWSNDPTDKELQDR